MLTFHKIDLVMFTVHVVLENDVDHEKIVMVLSDHRIHLVMLIVLYTVSI